MLNEPMDILKVHPIRKSKAQKKDFRDDVLALANDFGYDCRLEKGILGPRNIIIGNPKNAKYLVTAHYDTPASIGLPNLIMPCNFWGTILYTMALMAVLFVPADLVIMTAEFFLQDPEMAENVGILFLIVVMFLLLAGPANRNNANDNTSGVITVLEIARTLPQEHRDQVCFVLFDMEEQGLVGSIVYRWKHRKETNQQTVLNLDCVGEGDHILFMPFKKARKDRELMDGLFHISGEYGQKQLLVKNKGFLFYPSDQGNFPRAVGIGSFRKNRFMGYYCDKIHTKRDTVLEETNVNILRAAIVSMITCPAVNQERKMNHETV